MYDKVLASYSTPMTFKEYLILSDADQEPIDAIVKERTVARLIIKNSLNYNARAELVKTYSGNSNSCYPNTVSEALSLLVTFKMKPTNNNNRTEDEAIVSYHETADPVIEQEDDININDDPHHSDLDVIKNNDKDHLDDAIDNNNGNTRQITFSATVMASVINKATADAESDQFIGASFAQLQDVDDVYEDDESDIVCYAHVVDLEDDKGVDVPDFVADANINAENNNKRIKARNVAITKHSGFIKDFELMIYHTAQRVMHNSSHSVGIFHYVPGRPGLISHTYGPHVPESIIDYSDGLRFKFNKAGVHDTTTLMSILSSRTDIEAMTALKLKLNAVGLKGINTSTVKILREENNRSLEHCEFNCLRYHTMEIEIGVDTMMKTFPTDNILLHHVVSCVAINQDRRKPNRWVNKITQKLIDAGITSIEQLQSMINDDTLSKSLDDHGMPRLHTITITGFTHIMVIQDFHQGRS
jgi:hypothetical protein